jgi:ERCC4-related helicase
MQEILPGTEVLARGLRWEVVHVQPGGDATLYRLRCLEAALRGSEVDFVSPFERVDPLVTPIEPTRAAQLPAFRVYHDAFLLEQAVGPNALLAAQPGRLRIATYQLVPVMRALAMPRPRLLLADDVGLGKTVEAGLVIAELIARRRAHRILIVSPAGPLLTQWQREMRDRFGLRFRALDSGALQEIKSENELGANPFDRVALGIVSIDFAKQEKVLTDIERSHFDVVIIDEAHHCASLGAAGDRTDSQRRKLAEVLAEQSDALLLLTATPHDGFEPHFASLLELLDPSLLDGSGALRGARYQAHIVRRLKRHITDDGGEPLFRERQVRPERVSYGDHPHFAAFHRAMAALVLPRFQRAIKRKAFGDALAFLALFKRSVSTVAAAASTLAVVLAHHAERAQKKSDDQEARKQRAKSLRELVQRSERFGSLSLEEEQDLAALEAEEIAEDLRDSNVDELLASLESLQRKGRRELKEVKDTRTALEALADLAREAAGEDPKLAAVLAHVRAIRAEEPLANVLIYTEYSDSQKAVTAHLEQARARGEITGEILAMRGDLPEQDREKTTAAFTGRDGIVLVSTDASAEGLNLHARCHHLLHVELPYNPNRLEQRNGRIDRFGQTKDPIVRYLYLAGTFEERILLKLAEKFEKQRHRLGFMPNTLGVSALDLGGGKLLDGLVEEEGSLFSGVSVIHGQVPVDDTESRAYQDMLGELDSVLDAFERTAKAREWLGERGIAADQATLQRAVEARARGDRLGAVDLVDFVREAVRADSTEPKAAIEEPGGVIALKLPPTWLFGLDEMPGYDAETRTLRVTREVDREKDDAGRALAYLGRAHPIVRRALDRVRNVRFGGGEQLDRRVAVARGDGPEVELVYTYLGQIQSGAGRELERVIAVRLPRGGAPRAFVDAAQWTDLLAPARALSPAGVWKAHFDGWAHVDEPRAQKAAEEAFRAIVADFGDGHRITMEAEERDLADWLRQRAQDLCGPVQTRQMGLFDAPVNALPGWQTLPGDLDRVAAYAADGAEPARKRSQAQTVVRLHEERNARIAKRRDLGAPRILPLGLLLLVPESASEKKGSRRDA